MATIIEKTIANGELRFVVDFRDCAGRRRKERYRTKKAARLRLAEVITQKETGELKPRATDIRLRELADQWLLAHVAERRKNTRSIYRRLLDSYVLPALGAKKLRAITLKDAEDLVRRVREESAKNPRAKGGRTTANMALGVLKALMAYAEMHRYVVSSPVRHAKPVATSRDERRQKIDRDVLGPDELPLLFAACEEKWRPLIMTAALTGLRLGELLGLTWDDVDLASSRLRVERQMVDGEFAPLKTAAAERKVPLRPELVSVLKRWKLAAPKGELNLMFPNAQGGPLVARSVEPCGLGPALRRAGLRRITMHSLRHGYGSMLVSAGTASLKTVSTLMGHANVTITLGTYAHVMPGDSDKALDALGAVFSQATGTKTGTSA